MSFARNKKKGYLPISSQDDSTDSGSASSALELHSHITTFIIDKYYEASGQAGELISAERQLAANNKSKFDAELAQARVAKVKADIVQQTLNGDVVKVAERVLNGESGLKDELSKPGSAGSPGGAENFFLYGIGGFKDVAADTVARTWQVFTNARAWNDNIGGNNHASHYNQNMYQRDGDPASGPTATNVGMLAGSLVSLGLGFVVTTYQILHKATLNGIEYLSEQRKKYGPTQRPLDDALETEAEMKAREQAALMERLASFAEKSISKGRVSSYSALLYRKPDQAWDVKFKPSSLTTSIVNLSKQPFARKLSALVSRLSAYSYFFWLTWMPFAMAFGNAAADSMSLTAGSMGPIVLLISVVLGTAFIVSDRMLKSKPQPKTDAQVAAEQELQRLEHEIKLLEFIKNEHLGFKEQHLADELFANKQVKPTDYQLPRGAKSRLRQRMLGSKAERIARVGITGFRSLVSGILTVVFIAWIGSATFGLIGAVGVADFIGGTGFGGIGGALFGIVSSVVAVAKLRQQQLEAEQKVDRILNAPYKNTGRTKEQAFEGLYAQLEHRKKLLLDGFKDQIAKRKAALKAAGLSERGDEKLAQLREARDAVQQMDVYDDDVFEKFRHNPGLISFTGVKKFLKRAFAFIGSGQTGMFVARFFLLGGGVLAGGLGFSIFTLGAGFVPFLVAAIVLAVVMGVLAVINYQLNANQGHREKLFETIDARLYFMETKIKECCALQIQHDVDKANAGQLVDEVDKDENVIEPEVKKLDQPGSNLGSSDFNVPENDVEPEYGSKSEDDVIVADKPVDAVVASGSDTVIANSRHSEEPSLRGSNLSMHAATFASVELAANKASFFSPTSKVHASAPELPERPEVIVTASPAAAAA